MLIINCLEQNARVCPDRPAVTFGDRCHTWSQLLERVHRVSNMLISSGAAPGTPVVSILANSLELVELQLACLTTGAVYVPVMPNSVHREIELIVRDSAARIVVCEPAFVAGLTASFPDVLVIAVGEEQSGAVDYAAAVAAASDADPGVHVGFDAIAAIRYTSGTTGVPKGCITTQDRLAWAAAVYLTRMRLDPGDLATLSSPMSAGLGIALLHVYVCAGISMWILPRFDSEQLLELIERERITLVYAIETTFTRLTRSPSVLTRDLGSVRLMYANSPGKDAAEGFRALRRNPTWRGKFFNAYGSTEAGGSVTFNLPDDIDEALSGPAAAARTESIGRDAPFCRIECLDEAGRPVAEGELGELVVTAPSTFVGYLGQEEASAAVLRGGRLFTGDLAYRDSAGFVYMAGRKREMIKSGGLNVYPVEVEMVLTAHPDVIEAAVVGVPDDTWGEMVVAFVVAPGCTQESLKAHCGEHLAGYKRPKAITLVDALPKGETGKILKRALLDSVR